MEFIEFAKERERMCKSYESCNECGIYQYLDKFEISMTDECRFYCFNYPNVAQGIVQKWAEENPAKTRKSVLLEAFPDAPLNEKAIPIFCAKNIFGKDIVQCLNVGISYKCSECWNTPIEE